MNKFKSQVIWVEVTNAVLLQAIKELSGNVRGLENGFDRFESKFAKLENRFDHLEDKFTNLTSRIDRLEDMFTIWQVESIV